MCFLSHNDCTQVLNSQNYTWLSYRKALFFWTLLSSRKDTSVLEHWLCTAYLKEWFCGRSLKR